MKSHLEIQALSELTGDAYIVQRNAVLGSSLDLEKVWQGLDRNDWRLSTTMAILVGWRENNAMYHAVLNDIGRVDAERESETAAGMFGVWDQLEDRARLTYGPAILPLCWEMLLKLHHRLPEWQQLAYIGMIEAVPRAESIPVLLAYFDAASSDALKSAAAGAIAHMPSPHNHVSLQAHAERAKKDALILNRALDEID